MGALLNSPQHFTLYFISILFICFLHLRLAPNPLGTEGEFELLTFLSLAPKCWGYRWAILCSTKKQLSKDTRFGWGLLPATEVCYDHSSSGHLLYCTVVAARDINMLAFLVCEWVKYSLVNRETFQTEHLHFQESCQQIQGLECWADMIETWHICHICSLEPLNSVVSDVCGRRTAVSF